MESKESDDDSHNESEQRSHDEVDSDYDTSIGHDTECSLVAIDGSNPFTLVHFNRFKVRQKGQEKRWKKKEKITQKATKKEKKSK